MKLSKEKIYALNKRSKPTFPTYTYDVLNLGNRYAKATIPAKVGQMSELFPSFLRESDSKTLDAWKEWYQERYPNAIDTATDEAYAKIQRMVAVYNAIDKDLVRTFIENLVISNTYYGLYYQQAILAFLASKNNTDYRLATPEEEAQGIDGFVGEKAYSVKSITYKNMVHIHDDIPVTMIYYTETDDGLDFEVEE